MCSIVNIDSHFSDYDLIKNVSDELYLKLEKKELLIGQIYDKYIELKNNFIINKSDKIFTPNTVCVELIDKGIQKELYDIIIKYQLCSFNNLGIDYAYIYYEYSNLHLISNILNIKYPIRVDDFTQLDNFIIEQINLIDKYVSLEAFKIYKNL